MNCFTNIDIDGIYFKGDALKRYVFLKLQINLSRRGSKVYSHLIAWESIDIANSNWNWPKKGSVFRKRSWKYIKGIMWASLLSSLSLSFQEIRMVFLEIMAGINDYDWFLSLRSYFFVKSYWSLSILIKDWKLTSYIGNIGLWGISKNESRTWQYNGRKSIESLFEGGLGNLEISYFN